MLPRLVDVRVPTVSSLSAWILASLERIAVMTLVTKKPDTTTFKTILMDAQKLYPNIKPHREKGPVHWVLLNLFRINSVMITDRTNPFDYYALFRQAAVYAQCGLVENLKSTNLEGDKIALFYDPWKWMRAIRISVRKASSQPEQPLTPEKIVSKFYFLFEGFLSHIDPLISQLREAGGNISCNCFYEGSLYSLEEVRSLENQLYVAISLIEDLAAFRSIAINPKRMKQANAGSAGLRKSFGELIRIQCMLADALKVCAAPMPNAEICRLLHQAAGTLSDLNGIVKKCTCVKRE